MTIHVCGDDKLTTLLLVTVWCTDQICYQVFDAVAKDC